MADGQILSLRDLMLKSQEVDSDVPTTSVETDRILNESIDLALEAHEENLKSEEEVPTPPPSPTSGNKNKPSFFSLAQVSSKLGELWSSAKESIFGEDYWIPSDPNELTLFPTELLNAHRTVFPFAGDESMLRVVQGTLKNKPGEPLHHVVFTFPGSGAVRAYSMFRSHDLEEAEDFCRKCLDCDLLFATLDARSDVKPIQEILGKLHQNPLHKMIHIAIACNREDIFTDSNIDFMEKNYSMFSNIMKIVAQPEGKYPLHLAIELHRTSMVRRMLEKGADPSIRDSAGNTIMHQAALDSVQMLELLWEYETCRPLLNLPNNEGFTPVILAIRAANPRCLATLVGFGAEMNIRVQGRNALVEAVQSKGKNTDIIKAIIDASPDLVNELDSSGNSALHLALYKTPLMGLLLLKSLEMDLNVKNAAGLTPLHIYTHKGDIGLMITLLSYCCDINAQDMDGNTSLHIAVSKKNLEATRLLLCLGADPNILNRHGDTPRHLAARLKESQLLKSLIICGARRCHAEKPGCVSGCVNEKMIELIRTSTIENESPRGSQANLPANAKTAQISEENNIVSDFTQKILFKEMMSKLEEMEKNDEKPKNLVNLLSFDGGGIRGLVIIQMLMAIEEELGEPIYPYFDWVAGTSTGALVATALALGKSLRECQHIYLRLKDLIFDGWTRPFNSEVLETFMKQQLGHDHLDKLPYPRLMISTVKADFFPVKLEFMRNYVLPLSDQENETMGFTDPAQTPIWKALRRTSAAPMVFSPVDNKYIDGGIIANNPTLDLLAEVDLYNATVKYTKKDPNEAVEVGLVLSLGTGQIPPSPLDPLHVEVNKPLSSMFSVVNLSWILIDQPQPTYLWSVSEIEPAASRPHASSYATLHHWEL